MTSQFNSGDVWLSWVISRWHWCVYVA